MMHPTNMQSAAPLDDLLAHARWAERFARLLVRDDAEDIAQDAWLAAIRRPPAASGIQPKAWLATVLRNTARMRHRSEARRKAREEAAPTESPPSAQDSLHRMQLQRRLAELVLALDESRRTVVVLAFYDGRSAAQISRELGIPATTVRSRIASALSTIRAQLDADAKGDRSSWQLALAPLLRVPVPSKLGLGFAIATAAGVALAIGVVAHQQPASHPSDPPAPLVALAPPSVPPEPAVRVVTHDTDPAPLARPAVNAAAPKDMQGPEGGSEEAAMSLHVQRIQAKLIARMNECWQLANAAGRDVKGTVAASIKVMTGAESDATLTFDADNEITDTETLECLRENPLAIVDDIDTTGDNGPITIQVKHPLPPVTNFPAPADWPADSASPTCPSGSSLAGTHGVAQWCEQPGGTKNGPYFQWNRHGQLTSVVTYKDGEMTLTRSHAIH